MPSYQAFQPATRQQPAGQQNTLLAGLFGPRRPLVHPSWSRRPKQPAAVGQTQLAAPQPMQQPGFGSTPGGWVPGGGVPRQHADHPAAAGWIPGGMGRAPVSASLQGGQTGPAPAGGQAVAQPLGDLRGINPESLGMLRPGSTPRQPAASGEWPGNKRTMLHDLFPGFSTTPAETPASSGVGAGNMPGVSPNAVNPHRPLTMPAVSPNAINPHTPLGAAQGSPGQLRRRGKLIDLDPTNGGDPVPLTADLLAQMRQEEATFAQQLFESPEEKAQRLAGQTGGGTQAQQTAQGGILASQLFPGMQSNLQLDPDHPAVQAQLTSAGGGQQTFNKDNPGPWSMFDRDPQSRMLGTPAPTTFGPTVQPRDQFEGQSAADIAGNAIAAGQAARGVDPSVWGPGGRRFSLADRLIGGGGNPRQGMPGIGPTAGQMAQEQESLAQLQGRQQGLMSNFSGPVQPGQELASGINPAAAGRYTPGTMLPSGTQVVTGRFGGPALVGGQHETGGLARIMPQEMGPTGADAGSPYAERYAQQRAATARAQANRMARRAGMQLPEELASPPTAGMTPDQALAMSQQAGAFRQDARQQVAQNKRSGGRPRTLLEGLTGGDKPDWEIPPGADPVAVQDQMPHIMADLMNEYPDDPEKALKEFKKRGGREDQFRAYVASRQPSLFGGYSEPGRDNFVVGMGGGHNFLLDRLMRSISPTSRVDREKRDRELDYLRRMQAAIR